ncbi:MAG: hypothetical protein DCC65_04800 [Planctomycetota bacterium]|nr:MAG: hypothetical protein DCC65_04800 [Planctomycetota bacterium]
MDALGRSAGKPPARPAYRLLGPAPGAILGPMTQSPAAVYFRDCDYASPLRRWLAALADFLLLALVLSVTWTALSFRYVPAEVRALPPSRQKQQRVNEHMQPVARPLFLSWMAGCFLYHVGVRRLGGRTVGHLLTGTRVVDAAGAAPSWQALARRFFIALPTVVFLGLPYLACARDPRRRAPHDVWSGTWVVRARAVPAGPARVAWRTRLLGAWPLSYADVEPAEAPIPEPLSTAAPA